MALVLRVALLVLMLGISSTVVSADDPTQRIVFAPGQKTIVMKGAVTGYRSLRYLLDARAGQVLAITFTSTKKTLYSTSSRPDIACAMAPTDPSRTGAPRCLPMAKSPSTSISRAATPRRTPRRRSR